jgi:L-iditol 2-dehydrogenase
MGQLLLMVARDAGGKVLVSEPDAGRRAMASSLGADAVIDPEAEDAAEAVRRVNDGQLADVTVLTIGCTPLVRQSLKTVRACGRVVLFGGFPHGAKAEIDANVIHYDEIALLGSFGSEHHSVPMLGCSATH